MYRSCISQFTFLKWVAISCLFMNVICSCTTSSVIQKERFDVEYNSVPLKLSHYFDSCSVIVFDTIPEALFQNIDRILFTDNRVIVVDRIGNKCLSFDINGKFIGSTAKYMGKSKNEYTHMIDAAIDTCTNQIYMYNDFPGNMFILDSDMNLIQTIELDTSIKEFTMSDNNVYSICTNTSEPDYYFISVTNKNNLTGVPLELQRVKKKVRGIQGVGKSMVNTNGCYVSLPFDNRIFKLSNDNIGCIEVDFGERWIPDNVDQKMRPTDFLDKYGDSHWMIQNFVILDSVFLFNTNKGGLFLGNVSSKQLNMYKEVLNDILPVTNSWLIPTQGLNNAIILETYPQCVASYVKEIGNKNMDVPAEYKCLQNISENASLIVICRRKNCK